MRVVVSPSSRSPARVLANPTGEPVHAESLADAIDART